MVGETVHRPFARRTTLQCVTAVMVAFEVLSVAPVAADCPLPDPNDCVYVDDDCVNDPGSGTQGDPFCRIQDAYDSVVTVTTPQDPVTILVRAGVYQECVNASSTFDPDNTLNDDRPVHFVADAWLLAGSPGPDPLDPSGFEAVALLTTITGLGVCDGNPVPRLPAVSMAGTGASIRGFAITHGGASGVEARGSVDISSNLIVDNEGELGGGVQLVTSVCAFGDVVATISDNVVRDNLADDRNELGQGDGGGVFVLADGTEPNFIDCAGGKSDVTVADNVVHANLAQNLVIDELSNDTFAAGAGIAVNIQTGLAFVAPELYSGTVRVLSNNVFGNVVQAGGNGFSYGGGIFGSTFGFGVERLEVADNTVGPDNLSALPIGGSFGGGMSIGGSLMLFGDHEVLVHDNVVFENVADIGAGLDLRAIAEDMDIDQKLIVAATNNTITGNVSTYEAGGVNATFTSQRSLDDEDAAMFPAANLIAEELTFELQGNVIADNSSGTAAAGVLLRAHADADPLSPEFCIPGQQRPAVATIDFDNNLVENNHAQAVEAFGGDPGCSDPVCEQAICVIDPFCCDVVWDQYCAEAAIADEAMFGNCDCGSSDCCETLAQYVIGAGVLSLQTAKGEALARADITTSTIAGNVMSVDGPVGGIEIAAETTSDCFGDFHGTSALGVDSSIVVGNDAAGIGGPTPSAQLSVAVQFSDVFGNAGSNYADTLFPEDLTGQFGNISADPMFVDAPNDDFHLLAGSPVIDAGNPQPTGFPPEDFEGDVRVFDGDGDGTPTVDMGYDEYVCLDTVDADADGFSECDDCDDDEPAANPDAIEVCNGFDDDCDGLVDEDEAGEDTDADGVANACDNCPDVANTSQFDADGDGLGDSCDNCPGIPNPQQSDLDQDTIGDACDPCTDEDGDGLGNPGFPFNTCRPDNCPQTPNPSQEDLDDDDVGDACDNCPSTRNSTQSDIDSDLEGDHCDLDDGMIYMGFSDETTLVWQQEEGFDRWNLYRGDLDVLIETGVYTQAPGSNELAGHQCGLPSPTADDFSLPAPGKTAFFLTTGLSGTVEGDLGTDGEGVLRPQDIACTPGAVF